MSVCQVLLIIIKIVLLVCFYKQGVQIQNLEVELERVNEECQGLRLSQAELTETLKESQGQVGR